jgi:hypothetical protein
MSKEYMNLNKEYREMYESSITQMLISISEDTRFEEPIRHLCKTAVENNWDISKKINIMNIITQ